MPIKSPKNAPATTSAAKWAKWLDGLTATDRLPGVRWTLVEIERTSRVSRTTLQGIVAGNRKRLSRVVLGRLERFARTTNDGRLPSELSADDDQVISGAQTGRATHRGEDPGTAAAIGRHRVAQDDQQGIIRMIADAIAKAIQQAVQMNELRGGKEASAGLVRALEGFAEALEQQGADVSGIYRLALKIQRGEL